LKQNKVIKLDRTVTVKLAQTDEHNIKI